MPNHVEIRDKNGAAIDYGNPLAVTSIGATTVDGSGTSTLTSKSGTITAGGTAQVLAAANTARRGFRIQNQSAGDLWISDIGTAAATQPSELLPAGAFYEFAAVPTGAISIYGATTGQAFAAREW